ncbi:hypothetical protein ACFFK0_06795 [Paenibacillus chartarius]|uniref:Uncharacterized protein n=1 Tax=Paenibacillus chartarius TaxID=747481 RepID=A0ABV6DHP2_9BACL
MQTIPELGAEGGSLTLFGEQVDSVAWKFYKESNEGGMADFLSEDDRDLLPLLQQKRKLKANDPGED